MAGLFGGSALANTKRAALNWLPFVAAIPLLYLIQYFVADQPGWEYAFQNINHIGIAIILAVSLNLVNGLTGQFSIGHAGFMAVGGYVSAVLVMRGPSEDPYRLFFICSIAVGAGAAALAGWLVGKPSLRLRGDYLAIVTLGFGEILPQIARNGDSLGGFNLTNGPNGITPIDPPGFGSLNYLTGSGTFFTPERLFFWTVLVLVVITIFCSLRLRDSRLGRAWIAIREDETAAAAMGVPLMRTKTWAYATGAFFGGVAGAYFASFKQSTFPGDFSFNISAFILSMVILGGMGNVWGVVFGAAFLAYLNQEGLADIGHWINQNFGTNLDVPKYQFGIYGLIIVATMLLRPEGLIPSARRKAEFQEGVHDTPLYDTTQ
jgi:branched-chain amino acid transport system permease protein